MAFYRLDRAMGAILEDRIRSLESDGRPGLGSQLSVCWIRYDRSLIGTADALSGPPAFWADAPAGVSWRGDQAIYPASVVKLFVMVGVEAWLQRRLIEDSAELRRAMADMIGDSSNDATSLLVDVLSGTTSGPELAEAPLRTWIAQRQLLNQWFAGLAWPELTGCNICQKTWGDGPYGRERQFYGPALENRNRLTVEATARLLHAIMAGSCVSPPASARMRQLLRRSLDSADRRADPENQVDGFLGEGLAAGAKLWSKAGWMSQARHDAAYVESEGHHPFLLVAFSEGAERATDQTLLPALASALSEACRTECRPSS